MAVPTPLTTTFTPPSACFTGLYLDPYENPPYAEAWVGKLGPGTQCIPNGPNPTLSSYFSPGIYCPSGYTVACSTEENIGSITQTQATCCPSISVLNGISAEPFSCQTQSDMPWYKTYGCTMNFGSQVDDKALTYTYTADSSTVLTTLTANSTWGVNAYSVQLAWQASDLLTTTTSAGRSGSSNGSGASGPGVVTVTATSTSTAGQDGKESASGGLSTTTTKIAIGVVIPVVILSAIALGTFLLMKRRKKHVAQAKIHGHGAPDYNGGADGPVDKYQKHEMSAESASLPRIHELDSARNH